MDEYEVLKYLFDQGFSASQVDQMRSTGGLQSMLNDSTLSIENGVLTRTDPVTGVQSSPNVGGLLNGGTTQRQSAFQPGGIGYDALGFAALGTSAFNMWNAYEMQKLGERVLGENTRQFNKTFGREGALLSNDIRQRNAENRASGGSFFRNPNV